MTLTRSESAPAPAAARPARPRTASVVRTPRVVVPPAAPAPVVVRTGAVQLPDDARARRRSRSAHRRRRLRAVAARVRANAADLALLLLAVVVALLVAACLTG